MANRLLSFAGGLAQGYMNQSRYQDQQARQDKLDAMREQEFELRKRQLEGQIGDQEQERADRRALREDATADAPVDGTAVSIGGDLSGNTDAESAANSVQAIEAANQTLPEDQRISAGVAPIRAVGRGDQQKSFLQSAQGLDDAEQYAKTLNDPQAKVKRYTERLRAQGKVAEALKFESDYADQQQKLYQAQLNAITNHGLELISQGDIGGLAKAYNEHYQDGRTAVPTVNADGSGAFAIYQGDPKDSKQLGVMPFKSKDDLAQQFYQMMNPIEAMKQRKLDAAEAKADDRWGQEFGLKKQAAQASLASAGRARKSDDPLYALNRAKTVFKAAYGRDPTQEETIKLAGLGGEDFDKLDGKTAVELVKEAVKAGTTTVADAPRNIVAVQQGLKQARSPAALPSGLVVGTSSKQADGVYNAQGRQVTIQNGKVTEIK